MQGSFTE